MRSVIKTTVISFTGIAQRRKPSGLDDSDGKIQTTPKFALLHGFVRGTREEVIFSAGGQLQCQKNQMIFVSGSRIYHMSKDSKDLGGHQ